MTIKYSSTAEFEGVLINIQTIKGSYGDFQVARIKSGDDGTSQYSITFGKKFNDVISEDNIGQAISIKAKITTGGDSDKFQNYRATWFKLL